MKWTACATRFALGASLLAMAQPGISYAEDKDEPAPTEAEAIADPATAELDGSLLSSANRVYTQADFTQYNPRTALDMVQRIPGFSVSGSDNSQRGLGQAKQNVLLNGQRVSGKSNDAATALSRIDAADVIRIEVLDGATLDIPGLSGEVVNIVYRASHVSGNYAWRPQIRQKLEDTWLNAEVSLNGRSGATEWSATLANASGRQGHWGPELVYDPDGELLIRREEFGRYNYDQPRIAGSLSRTATNGNVLNLNAAFQLAYQRNKITGDIFPVNGTESQEIFRNSEDEWNSEVGGDYEFKLGGGRLKLIGLQRFEHSPFKSSFEVVDGDSNRFLQTVDESESVLRGEYRWKKGAADWQVSLEGAYNRLDSEAQLFFTPAGQAEQEIPLPGANAVVDEKRSEAILTYGRPIAEGLTLQVNLGAEYSKIGVTGDAGSGSRSYVRPKGSISLAWRANPTTTVNATFERRVDQLNFYDFLAAVDLANDTGRATNIGLVPPQRWKARIEATKSIPGYATIKPFIQHDWIEDIVETIPVSDTEEALGNVDLATALFIGAEGTLQFGKLGIPGARLDFEGGWQHTNIKDPLTGEDRTLSSRLRHYYSLNFRHDIPNSDWAWGSSLDLYRQTPFRRLDSELLNFSTKENLNIFIENKDVAGLTVRATAVNLLNTKDALNRDVYVDRRDGPLAFSEVRRRGYGVLFFFSVTGSF